MTLATNNCDEEIYRNKLEKNNAVFKIGICQKKSWVSFLMNQSLTLNYSEKPWI